MRALAVVAVTLVLVACRSDPPPRYASKGCTPRAVDPAPICGVEPTSSDRVKRVWLDGPETGGDQLSGAPCMGLLLESEFESGAVCRQRIASFASIGVLAADGVYVDDRPVCFGVERDALVIRRDDAVVARVPRAQGIAEAPSFPGHCVD